MGRTGDDGVGEQMSGRIHSNPGARLLLAARELFSAQGYAVAGINEIIARSGTSKKSFYNYYPGKRKLGEAYLEEERRELFDFLDDLMERHHGDFRAFVRVWAATLKKAATAGRFAGCPFAQMSAQAGAEFDEQLAGTARAWREKLRLYLLAAGLKFDPANSDASDPGGADGNDRADGLESQRRPGANAAGLLADAILVQYQGAVQMWRLSGDPAYFDIMEGTICRLAGVAQAD